MKKTRTSLRVFPTFSDSINTFISTLIDATALDIWVLERLRELFHNSTSDASLDAALRKDGTVFFLHLLGLDTTGHAYRPHSKVSLQSSSTLTISFSMIALPGIHEQHPCSR
jgi:hypothetical protein